MNQFYLKAAILFILIVKNGNLYGQANWQNAGVLYKDSYVTVELEYSLSQDICTAGNTKSSYYRYIILGKSRGYDYYINWKMDYNKCDGTTIRLTNNLNVTRLYLMIFFGNTLPITKKGLLR